MNSGKTIVPKMDDEFGTAVKIEIAGHLFSNRAELIDLDRSLLSHVLDLFRPIKKSDYKLDVCVYLDAEVMEVDDYWSNGLLCGRKPFEVGMMLKLVPNGQLNVWRIEDEDLPWFVLDMNKGTFEHIV